MSSLTADFDELIARIQHGRDLGNASFEPIYFLVFSPKEILEVKRKLPAWMARLKNHGWEVYQFSIFEEIYEILGNAKLRKVWVKADKESPLAWDRTNQALTNALTGGALQKRLEQRLDEISEIKNSLLLATDLEALHPYLRIGSIESQLSGKFSIPTVFLYPGERTGKTRLKFLGFYPEDGNYRSVHVGG